MRNRKITEQNLLTAVRKLVEESGFESLGINAVAEKSGVSKMLIYRYFESLDGLISAYIRQHDFWINFNQEFPGMENLGVFIKEMYHRQIVILREDYTLRRLYRWELMTDNRFVRELRLEREAKGLWLVEVVSNICGKPMREIAPVATLLSSSISYLALLEENCEFYNGIPIQENAGWQELENGINGLVDLWIAKL